MLSVEDFTGLAPGSEASEGTVGSCPRCGRSGIEQHPPDGSLYLHAQTSEVLGDGMRTEPTDWCRI